MASESFGKTVGVALAVCAVCSVLVSSGVVIFKGDVDRNKEIDKKSNILLAAGLVKDGDKKVDVLKVYKERIEVQYVDISKGAIAEKVDPRYDEKKAAKDPKGNIVLKPADDLAAIRNIARIMPIYLVKENNQISKIVLPIHGKGLWSTMYGFMALKNDVVTIDGFRFYEHGETPGLGGEVDNPKWYNQWIGKKAFDDQGNVRAEVKKGVVDNTRKEAIYQVDGLSGATLTARGVSNLIHFWLGKNGFGPYLEKLRNSKGVQQ